MGVLITKLLLKQEFLHTYVCLFHAVPWGCGMLGNAIPTQNQKSLPAQNVPWRENRSLVKIFRHILKQLTKKRYYTIKRLLTSKLIIRTLLLLNYTDWQKYHSNYNMLYIIQTGVQTVSNTLKQKYFLSSFCHTFEHTMSTLYSR